LDGTLTRSLTQGGFEMSPKNIFSMARFTQFGGVVGMLVDIGDSIERIGCRVLLGGTDTERFRLLRKSGRYFALLGVFILISAPVVSNAQSLAGKGSLGGSIGVMKMLEDEDISKKAGMRGMGDFRMRYFFSDKFTTVITTGFGWTGYPSDTNRIATQLPLTFGLELRPYGNKRVAGGRLVPRIGFGGGFYSWVVETKIGRNVIKDPQTKALLRKTDPGAYGEVGVEYTASPNVGVSAGVLYHYIFSEDKTKFPTAFGGNDAFFQVRVGVNYYFSIDKLKKKD
jgi:outer membrane protein W